ncbi:MAG: hypothetical protein B7Z15_05020 [Rhizobiales bacterium 32-66-8]|nr:MAG: hypothetical protein B7Z45_09600 [Azorhizobium sp. 12-66-6]OYX14115.1 MAG: hypothetical protein B7Z15_05020 [Rhizobiales bacterium 32-66-8]
MEGFVLDAMMGRTLPEPQGLAFRWSSGVGMSALLIVDDEPEYLDELVEALAFHGLSAISTPSGANALALLRAKPEVGVVLTDIRMPDMDGIAFIESAIAEFPARGLQFVVMTGHAAPADIQRAEAVGVVHCFPKPLMFDDLQRVLMDLCGASDHAPG